MKLIAAIVLSFVAGSGLGYRAGYETATKRGVETIEMMSKECFVKLNDIRDYCVLKLRELGELAERGR